MSNLSALDGKTKNKTYDIAQDDMIDVNRHESKIRSDSMVMM